MGLSRNWDLLLHQSRFTLDYVKRHVQIIQKGSKADQYTVQNLTQSGVYLRSTLSNTLLKKVLALVPLTSTRPEFFVATMTTFISDSYDSLEETLTHTMSLKLIFSLGRTLQISAKQSWYILSALRVPRPSSLIT